MRKTLQILATLMFVIFIGAREASATAILVTGDTAFTVNWLYTATNPDLSGSADFSISNWTSSSFDLTISNIQNTTAVSPDIDARLASFGFGLTPDATSFTSITNGTDYGLDFSNFPSFGAVDVCATAGANCASGPDGLDQGQSSSDVLKVTINGNFSSGVTFSPIPVKFQTSVGGFEFDGAQSCTSGCDFTPVPEPASLALLGAGLVAVGRTARRRRR